MRLVPSQIVEYIDKAYPQAKECQLTGHPFGIHAQQAGTLMAIVNLIDQLDTAYLRSGDFIAVSAAIGEIRGKLSFWAGHNPKGIRDSLGPPRGYKLNAVLLIRKVLESLPDESIPAQTAGLEFIEDETFRSDLRADIASADALLREGHLKAAMVISGSVIEALLMHALLQIGEEKAKETAGRLGRPVKNKPLDEWHLPDYVSVAQELAVISETCAKQASIAGDCRNLIHPGKARREERKPSPGTALSTAAGLMHVIEELTERYAASPSE